MTSTPEVHLPTPTPFTHIIQSGDTLSALAYRYSTSVDKILAANPEVNSNFLVIGEKIIIPIGEGENQASIPTATPISMPLQEPVCYLQKDHSGYCFIPVLNPYDTPVENLTALVSLYDRDGKRITSETAILPFNILTPGQEAPLYAYFPGPLPAQFNPTVSLLTALPGSTDLPRLALSETEFTYDSGKKTARVRGEVQLPDEREKIQAVWVIAIAYDLDNRVVGVRKWEFSGGLSERQTLQFDFSLLSLGPPIETISLYSEALPLSGQALPDQEG